jgi:tungstate transport system substrate-binding protein
MSRRTTPLLWLAAVLAVLVGCAVPAAPPGGAVEPSAARPGPTPTPVARSGDSREVILATTTSTQDSGLLDVLVPRFERQTGYRVKVISVGTGAALALGARGEADVVLVHAPEAERRWLAEGNGTERLLVMHNDFLIVGPPGDPAGIAGGRSALDALRRIAERRATWVSRDDGSGTDQLEKRLWREAGLSPEGQPWRLVSGQGMGATLLLADQKQAYTLSDRATYLARRGALQLRALVEGDPRLLNLYHVLPVNPAKFPAGRVNAEGGRAFAHFLVGPEAQRVIGEFGRDRYGEPLFFPDAGKTEEELVGP